MEPRIQYAKTSDGVSIAYAKTGEGPPLVMCPMSSEQFSLFQQIPEVGSYYERLGKGRLLVQYDDPAKQVFFWGFSVGDGKVYLTVSEFESDIYVMDLAIN